MARVLIIEADKGTRDWFASALADEHEVQGAGDARTGLFLLTAEQWDVMLLDPAVPDDGPLSLVGQALEGPHRPEIVVVATEQVMAQAVQALRAGAFEFMKKPIDAVELHKVVANAVQLRRFRSEKRALEKRNREHRTQLEALVQERTAQLEQIFANVPGVLYRMIVDTESYRLYSFVSSNCREVLGVSHRRLLEDPDAFDALLHPDDASRFEQSRALAEQAKTRFRFEGRFLLPSGRVRWLQCIANPTPLARGCAAWDGILLDVTDRMELQSQLLLSDRLATVGTMAAAVAHEVNNPLSYVSSSLDALSEQLKRTPSAEPLEALVKDALDGARRIENAMRDMSTFVRSPDAVVRPVSVTKVLDASVRLASNEIRHRAQLSRHYHEDGEVNGDEASLGQLFLNLLIVSAQSIPEGNAHENHITVTVSRRGNEVQVQISDSSPGLPPGELERAFDPFAGGADRVRAGMGLYVCQRIVSTLGGQIRASSSAARGNQFQVRLPLCRRVQEASARSQLHAVPDRPVRVLVVDDEELVLRAFLRTLEGHEVECARSGREAIEMLRTHVSYDLVLCDVMMPDMNGEDVFTAAGQIDEELQERFVFVTGGAFTKEAHSFLSSVPNRHIEKPFSKASIRALVADLC